MAEALCKPMADPNTSWNFCPNVGAAYFFLVLFILTLGVHVAQMIIYRKWYSLVIIASATIQVMTYIFRVLSITEPANTTFYILWFVLMMVAPVLTNAYVYMVMGRVVYNFSVKASVFKISAWRFGMLFVVLDVIAFLIQTIGAVIASGSDKTHDEIMGGLHIYMGGIGFQQACIIFFIYLAVRFHLQLRKQPVSPRTKTATLLLYIIYTVLLLITVRIIFRLIEYSGGLDSAIPNHEAYQYVFDSLLMWIALVLFNIWHPGRLMPGEESDFPSRKTRKAAKKAGEKLEGRLHEGDSSYRLVKEQDRSSQDLESGLLPRTVGDGVETRYDRPNTPPEYSLMVTEPRRSHSPA